MYADKKYVLAWIYICTNESEGVQSRFSQEGKQGDLRDVPAEALQVNQVRSIKE